MNRNRIGLLGAALLALGMLQAAPARADTFTLVLTIPVNVQRLSPNIAYITPQCTVSTRNGTVLKENADYQVTNWKQSAVSNRAFHGNVTYGLAFDMAKAETIDWGSYNCNLYLMNSNGSTYGVPSTTSGNQDLLLQPGGVVSVSGLLY